MAARYDRYFPTISAMLLAAMLVLEITSIRQEVQTWDEGIYLAAGYSYWTTGDFRMNREHPPLGKLLVALPLLLCDLRPPRDDPSWARGDEVVFGRNFLYSNRLPAEEILFLGRCATIVLSLLLGIVLALWTRARAGSGAALIALTLYAFDPTVIAHARYATNDLAVTFFSFIAVLLWDKALNSKGLQWYALAGAALGLAIATKFSALFLLPVFAIIAVIRFRRGRPAEVGVPLAVVCAGAVLVLLSRGDLSIYAVNFKAATVHTQGALSYLFGMESTRGWWWYFPAAFFVKAPVAVLILCVTAAALALRNVRELRSLMVLIVPIAVYGLLCLFDRADIGIRYLLPVYPFLFAVVAIVTARYAPRILVAACLALLITESLFVYPNYLAFFNVLAGGPGSGPHYLIDSNIDWGQDLKKLKWWLDARGISQTCVSYFGAAPLAYYGIEKGTIPPYWDEAGRRRLRCVVAVSVTYLYGRSFNYRDAGRWLRAQTPTAKVGYSIYVYDLRGGDPSLR